MGHDANLEICTGCGRPFVTPLAMLDLVDEGLYLLALHCSNCDRLTTGVVEDADLEALEQANEAAAAKVESTLDVLARGEFGPVLP